MHACHEVWQGGRATYLFSRPRCKGCHENLAPYGAPGMSPLSYRMLTEVPANAVLGAKVASVPGQMGQKQGSLGQ